jgi:hypothetical protein
MNWASSVDIRLPGGWLLSCDYGLAWTHALCEFHTSPRHSLGKGFGRVSHAYFHLAVWFAWCHIAVVKIDREEG